MPHGYQPPKFQEFDGKRNPKQHVAYFIETCETTGARGELLVKQFVRTLKGNAFSLYTDLEPEYIDNMLEQLLENQLIQLLECKRPEQTGKVDDPKYCKYHQVISHPIEKYFMLKELILKLAREKNIELDIDEVAQTNHVMVKLTSNVPPST
ncbi:retrotransposon gag protein [Cucumis melo var. makuwa]|uniref:Retrotransposon gag protein n=1 Tax=Cucumis melo var. makuwa TaxID=1194695 RepID=A0A5A7U8W8_CUCMM|nr:retrotransposon gag protein [Cucumis melo var. makuwa]TYK01907.1 retrotransposon gag protein [Cucumis melo var. makuwa]